MSRLYNLKFDDELFSLNKRKGFDRGWTQQHIAVRIGVKQSTVAKWERNGAVYRKKTRQKIAVVFGLNKESFR